MLLGQMLLKKTRAKFGEPWWVYRKELSQQREFQFRKFDIPSLSEF